MDVDVNPAVFESLQEVARQLEILSETEEATLGRPSYMLPPNVIEAHLRWGHTAGDIANGCAKEQLLKKPLLASCRGCTLYTE